MDFSSINFLSVGVATVAGYVVGAIYYMALGKLWVRAAGLDAAKMTMRYSPFVISFVAEFVLAMVLYFVLDDITFAGTFSEDFDLKAGVAWALLLWLGLVAVPLTVNHRYQGASWALTLIDGVHWLLVLVVMAGIIGWFGPSVEATLT
ncbi:MAG: DUF1761 domain-containing protein [Rhizobium sp.]|nr:DUF1761 domain-containing protein [Rhizobium sp.]